MNEYVQFFKVSYMKKHYKNIRIFLGSNLSVVLLNLAVDI